MKLTKGYKFCIHPNSAQKVLIAKTFGCCRFVYNKMLEYSNALEKNGELLPSRNDYNYYLTELKKQYVFLQEPDATALTSADDNIARAFVNYHEGRAEHPHFHKKKYAASYSSKAVQDNIRVEGKYIRLPKLGLVKATLHRSLPKGAVIKGAKISRTADGKFFCSIVVSFEVDVIPTGTDAAIGLDYKSDGLYVDSTGYSPNFPKFYKKAERRLAREQRRLARKKKGSSNYFKQKTKVARMAAHVANQRKDFLHKESTKIANSYSVVCVEDLNLKNVSNKKHHLGKSTYDNGFGMFRVMLAYKLAERGKHFVKVSKWYPSTQLCSVCGYQNTSLKGDLKTRKWICPVCGTYHDRDVNAAINLVNEGLRILKEPA